MALYKILFEGDDPKEAAEVMVGFVAEHDNDQIAECMTLVVEPDPMVCGGCGHDANRHEDTADAFCTFEFCMCGGLDL